MSEEIHPRYQLHYCRSCAAVFSPDDQNPELVGSPHARALVHVMRTHNTAKFYRCSRSCTLRAQHEELRWGRRLYGKAGEMIAQPRLSYDQIFHTEDDHT